jgi:hypothetical protein
VRSMVDLLWTVPKMEVGKGSSDVTWSGHNGGDWGMLKTSMEMCASERQPYTKSDDSLPNSGAGKEREY